MLTVIVQSKHGVNRIAQMSRYEFHNNQ